MNPRPQFEPRFRGSGRLEGKVAVVTGGDSGIGRAVSVLFAREGADVAILYLDEGEDARETVRLVEKEGQTCLAIAGDVGDPSFCKTAVKRIIDQLGHVDVLVNNAAEQHPKPDVKEIAPEQLEKTFRTNIFGYFFMTQAVLPHLRAGRRHHQHRLGHGLPGQRRPPRLQRHERRHHVVHALAGAIACGQRHSRQRRRAGADLDAADPVHLRRREGQELRRRHADEAAGPAERSGALLPVPRLRGFVLHHRELPAPERRPSDGELNAFRKLI